MAESLLTAAATGIDYYNPVDAPPRTRPAARPAPIHSPAKPARPAHSLAQRLATMLLSVSLSPLHTLHTRPRARPHTNPAHSEEYHTHDIREHATASTRSTAAHSSISQHLHLHHTFSIPATATHTQPHAHQHAHAPAAHARIQHGRMHAHAT